MLDEPLQSTDAYFAFCMGFDLIASACPSCTVLQYCCTTCCTVETQHRQKPKTVRFTKSRAVGWHVAFPTECFLDTFLLNVRHSLLSCCVACRLRRLRTALSGMHPVLVALLRQENGAIEVLVHNCPVQRPFPICAMEPSFRLRLVPQTAATHANTHTRPTK